MVVFAVDEYDVKHLVTTEVYSQFDYNPSANTHVVNV